MSCISNRGCTLTKRVGSDKLRPVNIIFCFHYIGIFWKHLLFAFSSCMWADKKPLLFSFYSYGLHSIPSTPTYFINSEKRFWCVNLKTSLCSEHCLLTNNLYMWGVLIKSGASATYFKGPKTSSVLDQNEKYNPLPWVPCSLIPAEVELWNFEGTTYCMCGQ